MIETVADAAETRRCGISAADIAALDAWVESVGATWRKRDRIVFATRLCIAELAANVFEHGAPAPGTEIIVTLHCRGDGIGIEFLDSGAPFDPTREGAGHSPSSEAPSVGGRGLMLLRAYAKDLGYVRDGARNHVTMTVAPG